MLGAVDGRRRIGCDAQRANCGRQLAGEHLRLLADRFDRLAGVDINDDFVAIAGQKVPSASITQGDMGSFDLGERFDVVICLFSSIGYVTEPEERRRAIATMARHVASDGALIIEPWILPEEGRGKGIHMNTVDEEGRKVVRIGRSERQENLTTLFMEYLVGSPDEIDHFSERHTMLMSTRQELLDDVAAAGLVATWIEGGPMGRGLVLGRAADSAG